MKITVREGGAPERITDGDIIRTFLSEIDDCLTSPNITGSETAFLTSVREWVVTNVACTAKQRWSVMQVADRIEQRQVGEPDFFSRDDQFTNT